MVSEAFVLGPGCRSIDLGDSLSRVIVHLHPGWGRPWVSCRCRPEREDMPVIQPGESSGTQ